MGPPTRPGACIEHECALGLNRKSLKEFIASHVVKINIENREFSPHSMDIIARPAMLVVRKTGDDVAVASPCKQGQVMLGGSGIRCRVAMHRACD